MKFNVCKPCCTTNTTCVAAGAPVTSRRLSAQLLQLGSFGNYLSANYSPYQGGSGPGGQVDLFQFHPDQPVWLGVGVTPSGFRDYPDTYYLIRLYCDGGDKISVQCFNGDSEPGECPFATLTGTLHPGGGGVNFGTYFALFDMSDGGTLQVFGAYRVDYHGSRVGVRFYSATELDADRQCDPLRGADAFCLMLNWQDGVNGWTINKDVSFPTAASDIYNPPYFTTHVSAFLSAATGQLSLTVGGVTTNYTPTSYHSLLPPVKVDYGNVSLPSSLCAGGTFRLFADNLIDPLFAVYILGGGFFSNFVYSQDSYAQPCRSISLSGSVYDDAAAGWHDELDLSFWAAYGPGGAQLVTCRLVYDAGSGAWTGSRGGATFKFLRAPVPVFQNDDAAAGSAATFYEPRWRLEIWCGGVLAFATDTTPNVGLPQPYATSPLFPAGGTTVQTVRLSPSVPCLVPDIFPFTSYDWHLQSIDATVEPKDYCTRFRGCTVSLSDSGDAAWDGVSGPLQEAYEAGLPPSGGSYYGGPSGAFYFCHATLAYTDPFFGNQAFTEFRIQLDCLWYPARIFSGFAPYVSDSLTRCQSGQSTGYYGNFDYTILPGLRFYTGYRGEWITQQYEPTLYLKFRLIRQCSSNPYIYEVHDCSGGEFGAGDPVAHTPNSITVTIQE